MENADTSKEYFISKNFVRHFEKQLLSISSAPYNGGISKARGFFFMYVDKNYLGDYRLDCEKFAEKHGLKGFVGFMTAVDIPDVISYARKGNVEAYVTAGLTNLTINICLVVRDLNLNGMVNAIITATEEKARIVYERFGATGTTSDAIGIFCEEGEEDWAGRATRIGRDIKFAVSKALEESIEKWEALD